MNLRQKLTSLVYDNVEEEYVAVTVEEAETLVKAIDWIESTLDLLNDIGEDTDGGNALLASLEDE
jgi:hypothetical protein